MKKLLGVGILLLVASVAFAAKEKCNGVVCNVQIKNANVEPACPAGVQWPVIADPTGCTFVGGQVRITWTGLNSSVCIVSWVDQAAIETNGFRSAGFAGVNGLVTGDFLHTPPVIESVGAPGLTYNIACHGLAQFNEQNSQVTKLTRVIVQ